MLGSKECLARAVLMEQRAKEAVTEELRRNYLSAAEGWRDLARRAQEIELREPEPAAVGPDADTSRRA